MGATVRIELRDYFSKTRGNADRFRAPCPVHSDGRSLNLSVKWQPAKSKWALTCYSHGCTLQEIASAAGFPPEAIYPERDTTEPVQYREWPLSSADFDSIWGFLDAVYLRTRARVLAINPPDVATTKMVLGYIMQAQTDKDEAAERWGWSEAMRLGLAYPQLEGRKITWQLRPLT